MPGGDRPIQPEGLGLGRVDDRVLHAGGDVPRLPGLEAVGLSPDEYLARSTEAGQHLLRLWGGVSMTRDLGPRLDLLGAMAAATWRGGRRPFLQTGMQVFVILIKQLPA